METELGELIEGRTYQPHTFATGKLKKGQILRMIDVEGQQVADFISLKLDDASEYLDCVYTNWMLGRWKWHKADILYTNHLRPMWTIIDDTVDNHYTGGGFCSRDARTLFGVDSEKGCRDTLEDALHTNGVPSVHLRSVSCFNIFMNVAYEPDGRWVIGQSKSKPGDHIDMRAEMDLLWAASICAWPEGVNGAKPTPLRFESYKGTQDSAVPRGPDVSGRRV